MATVKIVDVGDQCPPVYTFVVSLAQLSIGFQLDSVDNLADPNIPITCVAGADPSIRRVTREGANLWCYAKLANCNCVYECGILISANKVIRAIAEHPSARG